MTTRPPDPFPPSSTATSAAFGGIALRCSGVRHIALRSADLARARGFYVEALGLPLLMESSEQFVVLAGETSVAVHGPAPPSGARDSHPEGTGLDHPALACDSEAELARIAGALAAHGVVSSGVRTDALFERQFVSFCDPDGIRWEVCVA